MRDTSPLSCRLRLGAADQSLQLVEELVGVLELPVDRSEAHVGDLVELPQPLHDERPDLARGHLALLSVVQSRFDLIHDRVELRRRHGALLAGLDESSPQLLSVEGLAAAVLLHDDVGDLLDRFIGSEAAAAGNALPATADDLALPAFARVHDPVVHGAAKRAFHAGRDSGLGTRDSGLMRSFSSGFRRASTLSYSVSGRGHRAGVLS